MLQAMTTLNRTEVDLSFLELSRKVYSHAHYKSSSLDNLLFSIQIVMPIPWKQSSPRLFGETHHSCRMNVWNTIVLRYHGGNG